MSTKTSSISPVMAEVAEQTYKDECLAPVIVNSKLLGDTSEEEEFGPSIFRPNTVHSNDSVG